MPTVLLYRYAILHPYFLVMALNGFLISLIKEATEIQRVVIPWSSWKRLFVMAVPVKTTPDYFPLLSPRAIVLIAIIMRSFRPAETQEKKKRRAKSRKSAFLSRRRAPSNAWKGATAHYSRRHTTSQLYWKSSNYGTSWNVEIINDTLPPIRHPLKNRRSFFRAIKYPTKSSSFMRWNFFSSNLIL